MHSKVAKLVRAEKAAEVNKSLRVITLHLTKNNQKQLIF